MSHLNETPDLAPAPLAERQRPSTVRLRQTLFREADAIMRAQYGEDLTIEGVARRIATSRRQLQRAFEECGDTTFRDHLWAIRMDAAAELLRATDLTVGRVSHIGGYRQQAQFAKAFRRRSGAAPAEYRGIAARPRQAA